MIDRLFLVMIIVMLTINTVIDTTGNQKLEKTVRDTDIIAQCLDPNSRCSKFTAELNRLEREYLESLMKTTNLCVLRVSRTAPTADVETLAIAYDECVKTRTPPAPLPIPSIETPTLDR